LQKLFSEDSPLTAWYTIIRHITHARDELLSNKPNIMGMYKSSAAIH